MAKDPAVAEKKYVDHIVTTYGPGTKANHDYETLARWLTKWRRKQAMATRQKSLSSAAKTEKGVKGSDWDAIFSSKFQRLVGVFLKAEGHADVYDHDADLAIGKFAAIVPAPPTAILDTVKALKDSIYTAGVDVMSNTPAASADDVKAIYAK